ILPNRQPKLKRRSSQSAGAQGGFRNRCKRRSRRPVRLPLQGERAGVRGNDTPPTKTAGRILQAQLDRLPDSALTITSSAKPVDGGRARGRKRIDVSSVASPSPRPLPWGEGESPAAAWRIERTGPCGCFGVESRRARRQWERRPN